MISGSSLIHALTAAGLLMGGLLLTQSSGPAQAAPDYDPLLQTPGAVCAAATARTQFTRAWVGAEAPDLASL